MRSSTSTPRYASSRRGDQPSSPRTKRPALMPGEDALRGGFLVARRAVDLPGEEEAADRLGFERRLERARIEIVVLDRVAGPQDVRVLAALDRAHERELHVERQRRRDAVRVDLVRREAFGFEEDLVARPLGEAHDLVLDRRTVARTDALDDAGEQRRAIEAAANDLVRALVGVRDPAGDLPRMHRAVADEAEHRRRIVARLLRRATAKSIVRPSRRGGVPVFRRPTGNCSSRSRAPSVFAGGSPARPAS